MANTIKLKQGSGSDPSASDLVLGEPAIRTDTGEIFLKKDDGSIAKVAGGIDDGDKGDITVSNDGATFTIDNNAVTTGKFESFSQNRILGRIASGSGDATQLTAANVRTMINVADGATNVTNTNQLTNGAGFITATLTNEQVQDIVGGMVSGNTESGISVTYQDGDGTLDFAVTSQTDENFTTTLKNKLDGIAASATNVTNNNQLTNGAGYITATLTNEQVQDIVGGMVTGNTESGITVTYQDGDGTLDFSVASQTDNNFTTTLKNKLDGIASGATNVTNTNQLTNGAGFITATLTNEQVQDIVGGMVSGNSESGITVTYQDSDGTLDFSVASQTDQNFTTTLKNKLDGIAAGATNVTNNNQLTNGAGYITSTLSNEQVQDIVGGMVSGNTESGITVTYQDGDGTLDFSVASQTDNNFTNADHSKLDGIEAGATADQSASEILTAIKTVDGASSGLDADMLDGLHAATFLRGDTADEASGDITFSGGGGAVTIGANSDIRLTDGNWTGNTASPKIQAHASFLYIVGGSNGIIFRENNGDRWKIDGSGHLDPAVDSTFDIGQDGLRVRVGYFDEVASGEVRVDNGILETKAAIASSHTLATDYNGLAVSPTINSGVTVTVPSGAVLAIV